MPSGKQRLVRKDQAATATWGAVGPEARGSKEARLEAQTEFDDSSRAFRIKDIYASAADDSGFLDTGTLFADDAPQAGAMHAAPELLLARSAGVGSLELGCFHPLAAESRICRQLPLLELTAGERRNRRAVGADAPPLRRRDARAHGSGLDCSDCSKLRASGGVVIGSQNVITRGGQRLERSLRAAVGIREACHDCVFVIRVEDSRALRWALSGSVCRECVEFFFDEPHPQCRVGTTVVVFSPFAPPGPLVVRGCMLLAVFFFFFL